MLSIPGKPGATCEGFSRRELLRAGGVGLMGLSLGLNTQTMVLDVDAFKNAGIPLPDLVKMGWTTQAKLDAIPPDLASERSISSRRAPKVDVFDQLFKPKHPS